MEQIALLWDPLAQLRILAQDSECMIDVRSKIASIFILCFVPKWLWVTDKAHEGDWRKQDQRSMLGE